MDFTIPATIGYGDKKDGGCLTLSLRVLLNRDDEGRVKGIEIQLVRALMGTREKGSGN